MKSTDWTLFVDVNEILVALLTAVRAILNDNFVGMYLYGSLVMGDFNEATSDIDLVVAMCEPLSDEVVAELAAMHGRTSGGAVGNGGVRCRMAEVGGNGRSLELGGGG